MALRSRQATCSSAGIVLDFIGIGFFDHSASSERLACSVGDNLTGATVRDPVAWVAFVEETNRMKPTDKAILGMVSESPGRNVSEPRSGLDKKNSPKAEPSMVGRRQHDMGAD